MRWCAALVALIFLATCEGPCAAIKNDQRLGGGAINPEPQAGAVSAGYGQPPNACSNPPPGSPDLWYAARCDNGTYDDTNKVGTMFDWGSAKKDATQATDNYKPLFRDPCDTLPDGGSLINGYPCYDFDGTDDALDNTYEGHAEPVTVCYLMQSSETAESTVIDRTPTGGTDILAINVKTTPNGVRFYGYNAGFKAIDSDPGSWSVSTFHSGCIRVPGVGTDPYNCVDATTCGRATTWDTFSYGGGLRYGGARTGTYFRQLDLVEYAHYDNEDITQSEWRAYLEAIYGTLPQ